MSPRRRQPLQAVLALLLPVLLVAGIWLGGHPEHLPGFLRSALVSDHETLVVDQVIDRVAHDYYRPIAKSQLANASITGLVASLKDRFSHYLTPSEYKSFDRPPSFAGIGISVQPLLVRTHHAHPPSEGLLIVQVFDSSPAKSAGLKVGEVIVGVNGRTLRGVDSNVAVKLIKGPPDTDVKLEIEKTPGHASTRRTVSVTRATISEPVVASTMRTVHGIKLGVVGLAMFSDGAHGEVRQAVEHELHSGARGLVLDLEGNGGGLIDEAQLIASIFLPKGEIVVTTRGRTQPTETRDALGNPISASIPMVVLVDRNTASSSEILTAALQDHRRATVVGTHTFGKGVFQEEQPLSNGGALDITVGEFFTPNGRNLGGGGVNQGAGITPEVAVPHGVDTEHGLTVALDTLAAKLK
jgi:carboxyl-terminal processing protease